MLRFFFAVVIVWVSYWPNRVFAQPNVTVAPAAKLVEFATPSSGIAATYLRCEYLTTPLGIDAPRLRLSWIITSAERGQQQKAWQVLVASCWTC
jgi:hypothetical protein